MKRRDFIKISATGAAVLGVGSVIPSGAQAGSGDTGEMAVRVNPVNGDKTSLIGYGCMRWPMIKGPDGKDVIDQEAVNEMVDYAIEHGINYFDTSPAYLQGQSERAAGTALSRHPREKYYIATKLSNFGDSSREGSINMYKESFKDLRTDYIDYYLLHSLGSQGNSSYKARYVDNGMLDFLKAEKEAGRIRNLGFSFHGPQDQFDFLMGLFDSGEVKWDFCLIEMNYVDWTHADGKRNTNAQYLYQELDKRGIPIMVMEPLLGGRLARVPANIADQLKKRDPDASVASWAFRFVGSFPRVQVILSGMTNMEPLRENVQTFSHFVPMTEEELAFMERMAIEMKEYPLIGCTDCKYCMPCPWGLDIPGIFQHYNRCITDGTYAQSSEQKDYRKLKRAYLISYDRAVPPLRQASHCITCGECVTHCPQSIPIPKELKRIDDYIEKLKQDKL